MRIEGDEVSLAQVVARIEQRLDTLADFRAQHRRIVLSLGFGPDEDGLASIGFKEGRRRG